MARFSKWAGGVVVALALGVLLSWLIGIQAETAEAAAPKNAWVSPSEFVPGAGTLTWLNGGNLLIGNGAFHARVAMPAGKKIVGFTMYYHDNDANNMCATLTVHHAGTSTPPTQLGSDVCSDGSAVTFPNSKSITFAPYKLLKNDIPFISVAIEYASFTLYLDSVSIQYK